MSSKKKVGIYHYSKVSMLSEKNLQKAAQKRMARIALHGFIREYQNEKEEKDDVISYYSV
jgi:hypothetical protein